MHTGKILLAVLFVITTSLYSNEVILQNSGTYSGCKDTYLSAIYTDSTLVVMASDTQTNHSSEDQLHLSR